MKTLKEIWYDLELSSMKYSHYIDLYDKYFSPLRHRAINVLEIGVLGGGSLELWHRYFPFAQIFGADIDREAKAIPVRNPKLDRLHMKTGDIFSSKFLEELASMKWDIIIDDGPHYARQQIRTAKTLLPALNSPGIYWVEDLFPEHRRQFSTAWPLGRPGLYGYLLYKLGLGYTNFARKLPLFPARGSDLTSIHIHDGVVVLEKSPMPPFYCATHGYYDGRFETAPAYDAR